MPIRVSWDNEEKTVVRYEFPPEWTWRMLDEAMATCGSMVNGHDDEIDVILDMTHSRSLPDGSGLYLQNAMMRTPACVSFIVVATNSPLVKSSFSLLGDVHAQLGDRLLDVGSLDAARAVLAHPYALRNTVSPANLDNG